MAGLSPEFAHRPSSQWLKFLFACLLAAPALAHSQQPPAVMDDVTGSLVALSTPDLSATSHWYEEKLGFQLVKDGSMGKDLRFALLRSGDNIVEIIHNPAARPLAKAVPDIKDPFEIHGIFKLGFTVRNLDTVFADLKRRQVKVEFGVTQLNDLGLRCFGIRDIDGNLIQFFGR